MAKKHFSKASKAIWRQILGNDGGLSSGRTQDLVDILDRELELSPTMIRYGETYELFDMAKYKRFRPRDHKDDYCAVFYTVGDCEAATGSAADNWQTWIGLILQHGNRKSHPLAPRMKPPADVLKVLESRGQIGNRIKVTRFFSLETIVFYLAAQTHTWAADRISRVSIVKGFFPKFGVESLEVKRSVQEAIDVDSLFPTLPVKTRIPKAGNGLVDYNPGSSPSDGVLLDFANTPDESVGPVTTVKADAPLDLSSMSDAELEALHQAIKANQEERKKQGQIRKLRKQAAQGVLDHGNEDNTMCSGKPEYATVTVKYPHGSVVYYHQKLMAEQVEDETLGFDSGIALPG